MKITNTQPGPRGVNAVAGSVLIDPGQTWEGDVYVREQQHIEAAGWFMVEGDYTPDPGEHAKPPMNDTGAGERDENGDTAEMAQMRRRFDASYKQQGDLLTAANAKIADLTQQLADRDQTIADLQNSEPAKTLAQVLAMFDDPAVHFQTAKSEALKLLGVDAPASQTKDDLIAALKAKG